VIVVEGADGPDGEHGTSVSTAAMGRAALDQVAELARPGQRIGISWSRTLDAASDALPVLPRCTIVQLAGALPPWGQGAERSLFTRLAQDPALRIIRLYAPLLVTAAGTADDLVTLPEIDLALRAADGLDLALVSVGGWGDGFSSVWAKCCPDEREHATRAGAVAEVSGRLLALDGTPVDTLDGRVIAVSLDQLREARTTVGVAPGPERADAVLAACAAGILDVAVVDSALADVLLERLPASVHSGQDT
jgi:DNA-binding transcriptional regulator LsrR (DeoR family)